MVQRDPHLTQTPQEAERLAVGQHCSHMLSGFGRVTCPLSLGSPGQTWRMENRWLGDFRLRACHTCRPFQGVTDLQMQSFQT